jgi:hypothetical protein
VEFYNGKKYVGGIEFQGETVEDDMGPEFAALLKKWDQMPKVKGQ